MSAIQGFFGYILGFVMWAIYTVIPNYGIALLIFTLFTRLIQFPMAIKQQKSSAKNNLMQPRTQAIQAKYKDNPQKQQEEMQKLYKEEGYNPLSGCLPLLIQLPILYGLIDVVYKPLTHILRLGKDVIATLSGVLATNGIAAANPSMEQLKIVEVIKQNPGQFAALGEDVIKKITALNYDFLWMNLMQTPSWSMLRPFNPVILIPIISGVTALLSSVISMKTMPTPEGQAGGGGMMKGMMLLMPIMSFGIAFSVPAGVGLYWIYSNIFMLLQSMYMNKKYNPQELADAAKAERERLQEEAKQQEKEEREEAKRLLKEGKLDDVNIEKALSQKEINRRRLAAARKRDAEKYGEEYIEVDDDDFA